MQDKNGTPNLSNLKQIVGAKKQYSIELLEEIHRESIKIANSKMGGFYRNQQNPNTVAWQHTEGKLLEWAVYRLLSSFGCTEPEFEYKDHPTWDPDLLCSPFRLHIKSVRYDSPFGVSFTFQHEPGVRVDELFEKGTELDIVICGTVNKELREIQIVYCDTWDNTKSQLDFIDGEDLPHLKGKKLFLRV